MPLAPQRFDVGVLDSCRIEAARQFGQSPGSSGVLSQRDGCGHRAGRVFSYENLLTTDGSALTATPGVHPRLTITALAEHTMAAVPAARPAQPSGAVPAEVG